MIVIHAHIYTYVLMWNCHSVHKVLFAVAFGCRHKNNREFSLRCRKNYSIIIIRALLGSSDQSCRKECCKSRQDCSTPASSSHTKYLRDSCNGKQECHLQVAKENCEFVGPSDYETVSYTCTEITPGTLLLLYSK